MEKISRAERCRELRFKRPALMELGYGSIMGGLEEIMECSAEIHWAFDDDETLINAFDGNEEEAYEFRWAFTDLEAEAERLMGAIEDSVGWGEEGQRRFDDMSVALVGNVCDMVGYDGYEFDWFYKYFQDEHADRKNNKQDFTPVCVSNLMSAMLSGSIAKQEYEIIEEPAAGTGSTIIAHWNKKRRECHFVWNFSPDDYLYKLTELSDKTVPFLLFNLMIRGINAIVIHGNSLTKEAKNIFWVYNESNNSMGFSDLYICPHTEKIEKMFDVIFTSEEGQQ